MGTDKRARQKANRQARIEAAKAEEMKAKNKARFTRFAVIGAVVLAVIVLFALLSGGGDDDDTDDGSVITEDAPATTDDSTGDSADETSAPAPDAEPDTDGFAFGTTECAPEDGLDEPVIDFTDSFQQCVDPESAYTATFVTNVGDIVVELDAATVPGTVNNFVNLARSGYYDGTEIFRTAPSIGIFQGGAPHTQSNTDPGPGYTIPDEAGGFTYEPGQLVMARTAAPNSSSAQFFFVATEAAAALDGQGTYVVFGNTATDDDLTVVQDVLELHDGGPTDEGRPSETVTIETVTITEG